MLGGPVFENLAAAGLNPHTWLLSFVYSVSFGGMLGRLADRSRSSSGSSSSSSIVVGNLSNNNNTSTPTSALAIWLPSYFHSFLRVDWNVATVYAGRWVGVGHE